ncbi:aurofusarin cluster transcription factor aurR2 [Colletotrichum spaethianum]|uniref:Aurofusarin cluster transcription factor aurR2 n=1 Tax=Colletotrichum spaethianum TaxID=700344 RepID=A0AA37P6F1_9PEZI|nr:aurofusarin cluster transcription factor aurR2 [Colletotrichum spaethianum]GKT46251.1 aurofusarin cluster transcription factor aurR2 [Colletotrichum spaethianum]
MRVRLWWQLHGIDVRVRAAGRRVLPSEGEFGDARLPLNINDADLHPEMTELPVEHTRPTEMLCVLIKLEVFSWVRSSATTSKIYDLLSRPEKGKKQTELEDKAINELEARYHDKFLRHLDRNVPLHALAYAMATLAIARMRCKAHSPRGQAASGGEVLMSREESDLLFESIITWLEMMNIAMCSQFSSHLIAHKTTKYTVDAYIYVISDLRRRCSGERVVLAWELVEKLYKEHPELIEDGQNPFFAALGDLTLEAWEARRKALVDSQETRVAGAWPGFIHLLWDQRRNKTAQASQLLIPEFQSLDTIGLTDNGDLDWEYWNDFLRL